MTRSAWISWGALTALCWAVAVSSAWRYWTLDDSRFFPEQTESYLRHLPALLTHAVAAPVALMLGPLQINPRIREGWRRLHRAGGASYFTAVIVGAAGGLWLSAIAFGGWSTRVGFAALGLAWIGTAAMALSAIRRGDVAAHRRWAIRNFSLTFAAVMLRIWVPAMSAVPGATFAEAYAIAAWISWVPNLALVELWLRSEAR